MLLGNGRSVSHMSVYCYFPISGSFLWVGIFSVVIQIDTGGGGAFL